LAATHWLNPPSSIATLSWPKTQHPPHPGRRRTAEEPVVDDHAVAVPNAQQSDLLAKSAASGNMCGRSEFGSAM
jgi:hypothetical protein